MFIFTLTTNLNDWSLKGFIQKAHALGVKINMRDRVAWDKKLIRELHGQ